MQNFNRMIFLPCFARPFSSLGIFIIKYVVDTLKERIWSMVREFLMGVLASNLIYFVIWSLVIGGDAVRQRDYAKCMNIL